MSYKICVIGDGITALILSKVFLNLNIETYLLNNNISKRVKNAHRTVGISESNFQYLENHKIIDKKNNKPWKINEIKIFNTKLKGKKNLIFNFNTKEKKTLFYMFKNDLFFSKLKNNIKKNSKLKFLKKNDIKNILDNNKNYNNFDLIINCSSFNEVSKKFFFKKIKKNYKSIALVTIIKHKKILNHTASQYFTKYGPIAFLPLSEEKTSVIWSLKLKNLKNKYLSNIQKIKKDIKNISSGMFKNISFSKINKFDLNFSIPREYYKNNILIFGDASHQIHPLAGQGLNMTIRDIKVLENIIKKNISLGLELNENLLLDFVKKTKAYNFFFAKGNDFIENYFPINNKLFNFYSEKLLKRMNKNTTIKELIIKIADKGLNY